MPKCWAMCRGMPKIRSLIGSRKSPVRVFRSSRRSRLSSVLVAFAAIATVGCLNRLNVQPDSLPDPSSPEGLVFGTIDFDAPERLDEDLGPREHWMDMAVGMQIDVEGPCNTSFRIPSSGQLVWALPEGDYRIVHWKGILLDSYTNVAEAH